MTGRGEGGGGTEEDGSLSLSSLVLPLFPLCPHSILIPRSWSLSPPSLPPRPADGAPSCSKAPSVLASHFFMSVFPPAPSPNS